VATLTPTGPHVTPMVFATAGGRVWVTTSRDSVKARAWRRDRRVAGLVRLEDRSAAFTGTVTTFDLLDTESWGRSLANSPLLAVAGLRFTQKNARFFAGYAMDAHQVPLAWTPPGRVFAEIRLERSAIVERDRDTSAWGAWGDTVEGTERFRAVRSGESPLSVLPEPIRERLGTSGAARSRWRRAMDRSCSRCVGPSTAAAYMRSHPRRRSSSPRRVVNRRSPCRSTGPRGGGPGR
jgi:hypothetical protein